ncbi:MAG: hypothetical protein IKT76_06900 [Bacteroides sp.]|nr:hypothetical protein [Bacteroides sp.]
MKYIIQLLFFCILVTSCSGDQQLSKTLTKVESLLNIAPDSALHLLQNIPHTSLSSRKTAARYGLLLARATDKSVQSLLPCDSLLQIALLHYKKDTPQRATALIYQGRLEIEMNQSESALAHLQEALAILQAFPEEKELKRLVTSPLGDLYFDLCHYDEAYAVYKELYDVCETDVDKSMALNNISLYHCIVGDHPMANSVQKNALKYAYQANDSNMMATSEYHASIEYYQWGKRDSALYHAKNAIVVNNNEKSAPRYYHFLGDIYMANGEIDSAMYYLSKDYISNTPQDKMATLYRQSEVEKIKENYKESLLYLEEYLDIVESLYGKERNTEMQKLITQYNTKIHIREGQVRAEKEKMFLIFSFVLCTIALMLYFRHRINEKKKQEYIYQQNLKMAQEKEASLQRTINDHRHFIAVLQKDNSDLKLSYEEQIKEIQEREDTIVSLNKEKLALCTWLFAQSKIAKKINNLASQSFDNKATVKVLSHLELAELKKTIFDIYADFIAIQKSEYPKLTDEDLLYLALCEVGYDTQTIAHCFGFTNTHPINQRKFRLKERMTKT